MKDGHLNKCKECAKKDANKHRSENLEKVKEYDRNRPNRIERSEFNKKMSHTEAGKLCRRKSRAKWDSNNKVKKNAHLKVRRAMLAEKLERQPCVKCGKVAQAHHEDYSKPLDVTWYCPAHHSERHKEIRKEQRMRIF